MRKRQLLFRVGILIACLGVFSTIYFEPTHIGRGLLFRERFYHYRPISYWRGVLRENGKAGHISQQLAEEFRWSSTALPILNDLLSDREAEVRWTALVLIQRCADASSCEKLQRHALSDPDANIRFTAARGLGRLKRNAISSLPTLTVATGDSDESVAWAADYAIWEIDPSVAAQQRPWQRFASDSWQFAAMLPEIPTEEQKDIDTPSGPSHVYSFQCIYRYATIIVAVNEYSPTAASAFLQKEGLGWIAEKKAAAMGGKLVKSEAITRHAQKGHEDIVEVPGKAVLRTRVFLIGQRMYQIEVSTPIYWRMSPNAEDFILDSFDVHYVPQSAHAADTTQVK